LFKLINNAGLTTTLLARHMELDTLLQPTLAPGLSILTSGPLPPNPAELLGSRRMQALLATLQQAAEVVIIDSPPITAVVDATILSATADGVILVIRSGWTSRDIVKQALDALQQVNAHILGALCNRVAEQKSAYYTPQGYGYYRSAHWRAAKTATEPRESRGDAIPDYPPNGTAPSTVTSVSTGEKQPDLQIAYEMNPQSPSPLAYEQQHIPKRHYFRSNRSHSIVP
jgi:capsular exopolysaccharide synthesis family protein